MRFIDGLGNNLIVGGLGASSGGPLNSNLLLLPTEGAPAGLQIVGNAEVKDLVVRNNFFRRANSTISGQEVGMYLSRFERAIVEDNIVAVNDPAQGVRHDGGGTLKAFNNLNEAGTLLRAYNTVTQKFASELADEVENVYLAL